MLFSGYILTFDISRPSFVWLVLLIKDLLYSFGFIFFTAPLLVGKLEIVGYWLNGRVLAYISRVTLTCIIVAPIFIKYSVYNLRYIFYFSSLYVSVQSLGFVLISIIISFVISTLIEQPFIAINQLLYGNFLLKQPAIKTKLNIQ